MDALAAGLLGAGIAWAGTKVANLLASAASGLVGAAIGGAVAYFTLKAQLHHAAVEAKVARDQALKRDVLLKALDGMAAARQALWALTDPEVTWQQVQGLLQVDPAWADRVEVVAGFDTTKAADAASASLGSAILGLTARKGRLHLLHSDTQFALRAFDQQREDMQQLVRAMPAANACLGPDVAPETRAQAEQLVQACAAGLEEMRACAEAHRQASDREQVAREHLFEACMAAAAETEPALARFRLQVRAELGLPLDASEHSEYLAVMEAGQDALARKWRATVEEAKREMDEVDRELGAD